MTKCARFLYDDDVQKNWDEMCWSFKLWGWAVLLRDDLHWIWLNKTLFEILLWVNLLRESMKYPEFIHELMDMDLDMDTISKLSRVLKLKSEAPFFIDI